MRRSWLSFAVALAGTLGVISCNYTNSKMESPASMGKDFKSIQKYVLQPKCQQCHNSPTSPKGVDVSTYEAVMKNLIVPGKPDSSRLYLVINGGSMPPANAGGKLPNKEIDTIRDWIAMGAPLNPGTPKVEDPPPAPEYAWIAKYIFERRCNTCHNGKHPKTDLDLRTYASLMEFEGPVIKAVEPENPDASSLFREVTAGRMPPQGDHLTKPEIAAIEEWILKGAKEKR